MSAIKAGAVTDLEQLHRPRDRDTLRVVAYELRNRGLTIRDIATALQLTDGAVRSLLGPPSVASPFVPLGSETL
jgi:hypothetical protein